MNRKPRELSLVERLGWPRCNRAVTIRAGFAFGEYHGPATVLAERPLRPGDAGMSIVVEFMHPIKGVLHQACVMEADVER